MASDLVLNRLAPPGDQFTLVTLRVLDEAPDADALIAWYRTHLHQIVVVNRLEGTPDFAFTSAEPTPDDQAALVARLATTEHSIDLTARNPDLFAHQDAPFGSDSGITSLGFDLGDGRWLSALIGTLNWRTALADV